MLHILTDFLWTFLFQTRGGVYVTTVTVNVTFMYKIYLLYFVMEIQYFMKLTIMENFKMLINFFQPCIKIKMVCLVTVNITVFQENCGQN